jgi:hypothetical protein
LAVILNAKFGLSWLSGFRGEDLNVKAYDRQQTTTKAWQKFTWFVTL